MAVKGNIVLQEKDRSKLDSIVVQMTKNNESDEAIQAVVDDFKSLHGQKSTTVPSASQQSEKKVNAAPPTPEDIMSIKTAIGAKGNKPTQQEIQQSLSKEKPVTAAPKKQKVDTPEHIDEEARSKLDEIMYADDSRWKDPLRSIFNSYSAGSDKDRQVINRAFDLTQRSLMPDGFEAKKLLQTTHLGKEGDDNITASAVRNKAQEYDKTVEPLRGIQLPQDPYDQNENAKNVYAGMIENAAIKWWADKKPSFKRQLGDKNIDINDKDLSGRIDSGQRGMILNEYLKDDNVRAYIDKENPGLAPAADFAAKTNLTRNREWGANQVANEVSSEIQKSGYNKEEPIFNYWGKTSQEYANLTAEKMYADNPEKLKVYNDIIRNNQHEYLDAPSFFEGVSETAKDFVGGIGHTLSIPFTTKDERITDEWRKEASQVSADPDGYIRLIRDAGRATGFVLSMAAGGEVLQGAKIVTNPIAAQRWLTGVAFFGDELRNAQMKYDSPVKAFSAAALNTAGFVMLSDIFPAAKARAAFNEVSPELSRIVENLTAGKITKEVARQQANTAFKTAIDFGAKTLAQNTKISIEMTALTAANKSIDKLFGLDKTTFDQYHPQDEELDTFKSMFLSNGIVAGLAAYGEINKRNHGLENSWWEVANQPKKFMRIADEVADKNDNVNRTELYDNIKFLHETKKHLDQRGIASEEQKQYLAAAMKERVMSQNVNALPDETMKKDQQSQIKNQQTIKDHILKGEPVPDELYTQQKPTQNATGERIVTEDDKQKYQPIEPRGLQTQTGRGDSPERSREKQQTQEQQKEEVTKNLTPTIVVNGKEYSGRDHGEAMDKARAAGENVPDKDSPEGKKWRFEHGMFKERDGKLLSRDESFDKYGIRSSEELNATPQELIQQAAQSGKLSGMEGEMLKAGNITADQALLELAKQKHGISDNGEELAGGGRDISMKTSLAVDEAVSKVYPDKKSVIDAIKPREPIDIGKQTQDILMRINNAENINEKEIGAAEDHLYDMIDKNPNAAHLIEPLIHKIQNYEFTTKTETRTVTEKVPTGRTAKTKIEIKPALEQSVGLTVTVKSPDGSVAKGKLAIKSGGYVVDVPGGLQREIGEKAITDKTLSLPTEQEMQNPISFDKDGNVESVTVKDKNGNLITIQDPEKALDLAIQLQAEMLGEVPDAAFQEIYDEVQKQVPVEVLKQQEKQNEEAKTSKAKTSKVPEPTKGKEPAKTEPDKTGQAAEKRPGEPKQGPPGPREVADTPKKEWVAIRKEKMQEISAVKDLYERQSGKKWTEVEEQAMNDLQAEYPDKTLYEAARDKVYRMADMFDKGHDFNPSTADLAQIKYFLAEVKERRSKVGDWASEDDVTRIKALQDWSATNDDLLAIGKALNPSEAGRAFGYRQSESMLDPDNGLITRRMELMNAKGGERLSDEEMEWTADMWQKEKELSERQQQAREESLKEKFVSQIQKLQEDFDKRIKESKGRIGRTVSEKRDNLLKQSGKNFADKLRSGKLKGTYATIPGFPQTVNLVIEAVAQIVEKGATLAQAISDYINEHNIKDADTFRENLLDVIDKREKGNTAFEELKQTAQLNKVNGITKEMVRKNLIRDYVNAHVGEYDPKDILGAATKGLKEVFPEVTEEQVRDAYLKRGDYKIETQKRLQTDLDRGQRSLNRLLKIEKDIDDLRTKKIMYRDSGNLAGEKSVDKDLEARQRDLKKELIAQGKKYSGDDKYKRASYDTRAKAHNDRLDRMSKTIAERIEKGSLSRDQQLKLERLKNELDAARIKLDPQSRFSQKEVVDHGLTVLKNIQADFNKRVGPQDVKNIGDIRRSLQNAIDRFGRDADESEQNIKLARTKDNLRSGNDEIQRQLNAGEFDQEPPVVLTKSDAELVKLQIERNKLDAQYRDKEKQVENKNKSFVQKGIDVVRGAYVLALIYKFGTLAKVATASILRPSVEALTKSTFGNIAKLVFPKGFIKQAKAGGESSSWRSIGKSYAAMLRQMGPEKLADMYQTSNDKYEAAEIKYQDALSAGNTSEKELQKLKNDRDGKLLDTIGNVMYQYIGGSSLKDALDALLHRSNAIEREFGFLDKEGIEGLKKGQSVLSNVKSALSGTNISDNINYLLGFVGRSHSALKTFSGRAGFAGSFMARLEAAQMDGIEISDPDVQLKLAKDAYIDWDKGKYQQSNFVSDAWNKIIQKLDKTAQGQPWEKYYKALGQALRFDVAITRVPVNILHESVAEYALGAFRAMFDAGNEYRKARREVMMNQNIMPGDEEFKSALKEQLAQIDAQKAATIVRCFRKGGFGLGMFALLSIGGLMKYGGFHHKGEQKKTDEEKEAGELDPGEVMMGDKRLGTMVSKIIEHTPSLYPALLGLNTAKIYQDKIEEGKETYESAFDALVADLEEMQDAIPQSEIIKPVSLIGKVTTGSMRQLDKAWEWNDVDQDGNLIERKPLNFKDEFNMLTNRRDKVLTKENYAIAKSILDDFKKAIRDAHKSGASKEEIDQLKKDRDEQINQIYELNSQKQ